MSNSVLLILGAIIIFALLTRPEPFGSLLSLSEKGKLQSVALTAVMIPQGTIAMWAGAIGTDTRPALNKASVPEGWGLCDGSAYTYNGRTTTTPDLRGRFIRMYSDDADYQAAGFMTNARLADMNVPTAFQQYLGISRSTTSSGIFKLGMGSRGGTDHTVLSTIEIPAHTHTMAHTHDLSNHTHTMAHTHDFSHNHDISHTHTFNQKCAGSAQRGSSLSGDRYCNSNDNSQTTSGSSSATTNNQNTSTTGGATNSTTSGPSANTTGGASNSITSSVGSGEGHNNVPPFYVLAYIMKL